MRTSELIQPEVTHILTDVVAASLCEAFQCISILRAARLTETPLHLTPRKFSRHGAARVDFLEDSLSRFECHDRRVNERARSRRIQRQTRFASAAISKAPAAEARLATREALLRRDLHVSNHAVRCRSISLPPQQ